MKRKQLLTAFSFIVALLNAQNEYDFLGKGARAAGMAYAFSAISDDATAMSWNPAGIVQIKKPEFAFVNSLTAIKRENGLDKLNYKPTYMIDYMGFVYPLKIKMKDLVFGVSFQNKMNFKYKNVSVPSELSRHEGNNSLTVNAVTLCGAYSINRFIAAGFSYNHWFSMGNKEDIYDEYNSRIDTSSIYDVYKKFDYSGNNITAGVLLDFASVHFPLRFAIKYENRFILKRNYDETSQIDNIYANYEDENWTSTYNGNEKFYIPSILTTGLSYRVGDDLTIACDLEFRLFSGKYYVWNYRSIEKYTTNNQTTLLKDTIYSGEIVNDKFSSKLNQYRFGMEYILHLKSALIPIRLGWKNNPTSLFNRLFTAPSQVYAHSLNFGAGFITKRFSIDFAYEQYKYEITDDHDNLEKRRYGFFLLSTIIYIK
jgi:long-subunit fatty acid transport protein